MKSSTILNASLPFLVLLLPALFVPACSGDDDDSTTPTASLPPGDDDASQAGDDDSSQGDDDATDAIPSPYAKAIYIRGTFNNWTGDAALLADYELHTTSTTSMAATVLVPAGAQRFKVADNAWSGGTNFGNPAGTDDVIKLDKPKTLGDNGFDLLLTVDTSGMYSFTLDTTTPLKPIVTVHFEYEVVLPPQPDISVARAYWVNKSTLVWRTGAAKSYFLYYAPEGGITLTDGVLAGGTELPVTADGTLDETDPLYGAWPYLKGQGKFDTSSLTAQLPDLLTGQVVVASRCEDGTLCDATGIQIAGVLDDLYAYSGSDLGVTFAGEVPTLKLWAPTAKAVRVAVYENSSDTTPLADTAMSRDATGVWSVTGTSSWKNRFYVYEVSVYVPSTGKVEKNRVTDPYSVSLSTNGTLSQMVDMNDTSLEPSGWTSLSKPALDAFEDIALYELHVRDFSVSDATVPELERGKFLAFTESESDGMSHLKALAGAGMTHLHIMPAFDISTIDEDVSHQETPDIPTAGPSSPDQQAAVEATRDTDAFNWGYDPFHYLVPEGSYASHPDGPARILEFRQMVQGINQAGLRMVMDVVFNHTTEAGQGTKSVLDKIVPGYYYRLSDTGAVQSSSCCADTATEHLMMEKLMLDAVKLWATKYKVDGFRFDLMGHHTKENMAHVRSLLDSLTLEKDGVDGSKIYVYGEAWKYGSLDAITPLDAFSQPNSYGYGIGSFNDRIRDSVRGGNPFAQLYEQGFITGMYYDDNYLAQGDELSEMYLETQKTTLLNLMDNIRLGMAGNLRDYEFTNSLGEVITGAELLYRGSPGAGYTADPQEDINYCSVHDNQTLWDLIAAKAPFEVSGRTPETATMAERVRMQNLGIALIALGQGVPFFLAGDDLLRSKSGDGNSYDSGDWFNRLDWTFQSNNWGVGLPLESQNSAAWELWEPRLADASLEPAPADIQSGLDNMQEMLRIRKSSILFRLRTGEDIQKRVRFLNTEEGPDQIPGLIVMTISDKLEGEADLDPEREMVVSLFNATLEPISFTDDALKVALTLHPVQQASSDAVVAAASCGTGDGSITVPPRTAMVCYEAQSADRPRASVNSNHTYRR